MYKFPHGNRQATVMAESYFDAIDLPPFAVDAFPPEARPKAIRDYCSYVLSTFNHQGIRPRGMLLRLDDNGIYYPTLELLTADNKQGAVSDGVRVGYTVTMDERLDAIVKVLSATADGDDAYNWPPVVTASLYVTTDGQFSKRSGTVSVNPSRAGANAISVSLPNIEYAAGNVRKFPVKISTSLYATRSRGMDGGSLSVNADGGFHLITSTGFIRNLMDIGILDNDTAGIFSIGLNGIILSGSNGIDKVTDVFDAQINAMIVPPYVPTPPADGNMVHEMHGENGEKYDEWKAREQAYNTPALIPVIHPARVDKFVDPTVHAPWAVKTPSGAYATNFLKLGSGNLLDVSQFWGEQDKYRLDADGSVGELLLSISRNLGEAGERTEIHRVKLNAMRFYLEQDAYSVDYRKVGESTIGMAGCEDAEGNPSELIPETGMGLKVAFSGNLRLNNGSWALNGQSVVPICPEGSPVRGYVFKVLGWYPELRMVRKDLLPEAGDDADQMIPPHLVECAYGAYLAGLVDGQEAMPRSVFVNQPTKKLISMTDVLNFARGLAAKHVKQEKVADNPLSLTKEDVKLDDSVGLKVSGTLLMRGDSETVQSEKPLTTTSQGITLTGDPVTITGTIEVTAARDDVENKGAAEAE